MCHHECPGGSAARVIGPIEGQAMKRLWAVALASGLLAGQAGAVPPDPGSLAVPAEDLARARLLVKQLGSPVFRDREKAESELTRMGRLARPALLDALRTDPNPEVRSRVSRLFPRADAADLQARIETFLADADGKYDHDLPAWALFRKQLGTSKAVRELYVEVLKSQPNQELLAAITVSNEVGGRAIADRRLDLYLEMNPGAFGNRIPARSGRPRQPSLADVALLLFAESVIPSNEIPKPGPFVFVTGATFIQQPGPMKAINDPEHTPHGEPYRQILVKWLDTRTAPTDLDSIVHVVPNLRNLKETTALLRRIITTDGVQGWAKGQALMTLVQRDKEGEVPFLRRLLKDETVVTMVYLGNDKMGQPIQASCQLRDVALAMLLVQSGQDLRAYGYQFPPGAAVNNQNIGYGNYAFTEDGKRDAAMKKFAEWESKKMPEKKPEEKK
jgi:hypothetical protein